MHKSWIEVLQVALRGDLLLRGGSQPFYSFLTLRSAAVATWVDVWTVVANYLVFRVQDWPLYVDYSWSRIITSHWFPCRYVLVFDVPVLPFLEIVAGKPHIPDILRTAFRSLSDLDVLRLSERTFTSLDIDLTRDNLSIEQQSLPILDIILKSSDWPTSAAGPVYLAVIIRDMPVASGFISHCFFFGDRLCDLNACDGWPFILPWRSCGYFDPIKRKSFDAFKGEANMLVLNPFFQSLDRSFHLLRGLDIRQGFEINKRPYLILD